MNIKTRIKSAAALVVTCFAVAGLTGCHSTSRADRGALIGAGIGTIAGASIDHDHPGRGAVVGAAIGALGGYAISHDSHYDHHDGPSYRSPRRSGYDRGYGRRGYRDRYDRCDDY